MYITDTRRTQADAYTCDSRKVTTVLSVVAVAAVIIVLTITLGSYGTSVARITLESEKVTPPTAGVLTVSVEVPRGDFDKTVPVDDELSVTATGVDGLIVIRVNSLRDDESYALYTGEGLSPNGETTYFWVQDNRPDSKVHIKPYEWPHPDGGRLILYIAPV